MKRFWLVSLLVIFGFSAQANGGSMETIKDDLMDRASKVNLHQLIENHLNNNFMDLKHQDKKKISLYDLQGNLILEKKKEELNDDERQLLKKGYLLINLDHHSLYLLNKKK